jgi:hypothetical protein
MRPRSVAVGWLLLVLMLGCGPRSYPEHVLPDPFPGRILAARVISTPCVRGRGCLVAYRVQITNPTDEPAHIRDCVLAGSATPIPLMNIGGYPLERHVSFSSGSRTYLQMPKRVAKQLGGKEVSCTGIEATP